MSSHVYEALANSSCIWECVVFGLPNFSSSLFESSTIQTTKHFWPLDSNLTDTSYEQPILTNQPQYSSTPSRGSIRTPNRPSRKKNKIRGMILNCNGLKGFDHIAKFQALLDLHDPDFVLGTESKLCPDISSYSIFPANYWKLEHTNNNSYKLEHTNNSFIRPIQWQEKSISRNYTLYSSKRPTHC